MTGKGLLFLGLVLVAMFLDSTVEEATEPQSAEIQESAYEEGELVGDKLHIPGFHLPGHGHSHGRRCCKRFGTKCIHYCSEDEKNPIEASAPGQDAARAPSP